MTFIGTGKTLLAQAVANECGATLFAVRPSDVLSKYQGESERYLRDLFDNAQRLRKAIIFFDEFDSIAVARGRLGSEEGHSRRLLAELLIQLSYNRQKFQPSTREDESKQSSEVRTSVCIIAATNRIEDIDDAILRRFDSKIGVHLPSHDDRVELLESFLEGIDTNLSEDDMHQVAGMTQDWSGSDLESLCREAAMNPMRSVLSYLTGNVDPTMSIPAVTIRDFGINILPIISHCRLYLLFIYLFIYS
jgi:SpoVK/Ycf46/Vps4 family AAA+-type ATPase